MKNVTDYTQPQPINDECDWCGDETEVYQVAKPDGMPGDICIACLVRTSEIK